MQVHKLSENTSVQFVCLLKSGIHYYSFWITNGPMFQSDYTNYTAYYYAFLLIPFRMLINNMPKLVLWFYYVVYGNIYSEKQKPLLEVL